MPANSPQEVTNLIAQRLNRGDLDGIMALYEPNAGLAPQPGQVLQGAAAIREGFAGFIALKPSMNMESETVIQAEPSGPRVYRMEPIPPPGQMAQPSTCMARPPT